MIMINHHNYDILSNMRNIGIVRRVYIETVEHYVDDVVHHSIVIQVTLINHDDDDDEYYDDDDNDDNNNNDDVHDMCRM